MSLSPRPRRRSPARVVAAAALFVSFAIASLGWISSPAPQAEPLAATATLRPEEWTAIRSARDAFRQSLAAHEAVFEAVDPLTPHETRLLRRSLNAAHVGTAERLGIAPVATDAELPDAEGLAPLDGDSPYYATRWGRAPLTPDALAALDAIGERFQEKLANAGLPPYRFVVSSTFRTAEHQDRLRGVNANAARGRSSHEFGTTFDIAYRRYRFNPEAGAGFAERPVTLDSLSTLAQLWVGSELDATERAWADDMAETHADALEALLGRALIELEDEGVLLALREVRQPCFHVTVARHLAR